MLGPLPNMLGPLGAAVKRGLVFLLRDDFTTPEAAPLASPRTCEPGPGTLTLFQLNASFSISAGRLQGTVSGSPAFGQLAYLSDVVPGRPVGVVHMNEWRWSNIVGSFACAWAINSNLSFSGFANCAGAIYAPASGSLSIADNATGMSTGQAVVNNTNYRFAVIGRTAGWFHLVKGGTFAEWTLVWVSNADTHTGLRPAYNEFNSTGGSSDFAKVIDLPANGFAIWADDYGIATERYAGSVSVGQVFTHEANCLIEWTQTTLPSVGSGTFTRVEFRSQDTENNWAIRITESGAFQLIEVVLNSGVVRASINGAVIAGYRVVIVADGSTIRGYSNNVLRWTYSAAINFQTETDGVLVTLGTNGAISDLITWPRTLSGAALAALEAVANA